MKQIFQKVGLLLTFGLMSGVAMADELPTFTVGNNTFQVNDLKNKTCTFMSTSDEPAIFVVPETAEYEEITFTVNTIGSCAFQNMNTSVITLPNTITEIESYAFAFSKVSSVDLGSSLSYLDDHAFYMCDYLSEIEIPKSLFMIGDGAFAYSGIENIVMPNTLFKLGDGVFESCSALTSCNWPTKITTIPDNTFSACSNLASFSIPSNITAIGSCAFQGCEKLSITSLPEGLTEIGDYAFMDCEALSSINIPEGLNELAAGIFYGCTGLTGITIPADITTIGAYAFGGCTNLTTVDIKGHPSLEDYAFSNCAKLTTMSIWYGALLDQTDPETTFYDTPTDNIILYVPNVIVSAYASADPWKNFKNVLSMEYLPTDYELVDGDTYNTVLPINTKSLTYTRTYKSNVMLPLYVPFSMSYNDWADQGLRVYRLNGFYEYDDNKDGAVDRASLEVLEVTAKDGRLKPNHPYLIKSINPTSQKISIKLDKIELAPSTETVIYCSTVETKYDFTGTYTALAQGALQAMDAYVMSGGSLKLPGESGLGAQRWYMTRTSRGSQLLPPLAEIKIFIHGEDDADAISTTSAETNLPTYNLMGQKVADNMQKGITIKNGRKYVK